MKKILTILIAAAMLLSFAACSGNGGKPEDTTTGGTTANGTTTAPGTTAKPGLSGELKDIMDDIYANAAENDFSASYKDGAMQLIEITADQLEYFYGCTFEFEQALASEYMMAPPAYSLSLIRLPEGADVAATVALLKDKINPMRWICVGVDKVEVVNVGNVIGVFMATADGAKALSESFLKLSSGSSEPSQTEATTAAGSDAALSGDLLAVADKIYADANVSFAEALSMFKGVELDASTAEQYLGTKVNFESAISSECMRIPPAYGMMLIRLLPGEDVEAAKSAIKDNVKTDRWVCVCADYLLVESVGNVIAVIMTDGEMVTDADADAMMSVFTSMK